MNWMDGGFQKKVQPFPTNDTPVELLQIILEGEVNRNIFVFDSFGSEGSTSYNSPKISCYPVGNAAAIEYNNWIVGFITGFGPGQPEGTELHFWLTRMIFYPHQQLHKVPFLADDREIVCEDDKYISYDGYNAESIQQELAKNGVIAIVRRISGHTILMGITRLDISYLEITGPNFTPYELEVVRGTPLFNSFFLILSKDKQPTDYKRITVTAIEGNQFRPVGVNSWPKLWGYDTPKSP